VKDSFLGLFVSAVGISLSEIILSNSIPHNPSFSPILFLTTLSPPSTLLPFCPRPHLSNPSPFQPQLTTQVYDVELRKITLKLEGHADDINAVCFADPISTNVLFSGSDDSLVKVWDRRSMAGGREAGCLVGHMEGITFVSSKGDGR
jgi:WD40 repeat protein